MAYLINSSGLVTTGTTGADLFQVESGGVGGSTLKGLAGADTITVNDGASTATSVSFDLAGDKDKLALSGGSYAGGTVQLGAGADQFSGVGVSFSASTLKLGGGNDTLTLAALTGNTFAAAGAKLLAGGGDDSITFSQPSGGSLSSLEIGLGAGADTLSLQHSGGLSSANIYGGGGADSIVVSGIVSGAGFLLNGDSTVNGGGADTITFDVSVTASTVKGKGGADVITVSALTYSSRIEGNAGADSIVMSAGIVSTGNFIGGGSGNDTIEIGGAITGISAGTLALGGGADSLYISALAVDDMTGLTIKGGAGADTIDIKGVGLSGHFAYDALTDSTVAAYDTILSAAATGGIFSVSAVMTTTLTTGVIIDSTSATINTGVVTDGILSGSDFKTSQSVTARAEFVDSKASTKGNVVFFEANDDDMYLFIQGGSSGTADDLVVNLDDAVVDAGFTLGSGNVTIS